MWWCRCPVMIDDYHSGLIDGNWKEERSNYVMYIFGQTNKQIGNTHLKPLKI
jgi:hypothetical protein